MGLRIVAHRLSCCAVCRPTFPALTGRFFTIGPSGLPCLSLFPCFLPGTFFLHKHLVDTLLSCCNLSCSQVTHTPGEGVTTQCILAAPRARDSHSAVCWTAVAQGPEQPGESAQQVSQHRRKQSCVSGSKNRNTHIIFKG